MVTRVVVLGGVSSQRRPCWLHGYKGLGVGKCIISEAPPGGYLVTRVGVLA